MLDVMAKPRRESDDKRKPTLEAARQRLGGRAPTAGGRAPGTIVELSGKPAAIVFASDTELHVLIDATEKGARMRKTKPELVGVWSGDVPAMLGKMATDASVFARLLEGQNVRYADDSGALRAARLIEKCRYGALVARDDGTIVAVGFRKLWPGSSGEAS